MYVKGTWTVTFFRIVLRVQFYSRKSFSSPFIIQTFEFKLLWPLREFISSQFELWAQLDTRQMLLPNWVFQVIKVPYCHFFPQGFGGLSFTIHTRSTFISGNIPSINWLGGKYLHAYTFTNSYDAFNIYYIYFYCHWNVQKNFDFWNRRVF